MTRVAIAWVVATAVALTVVAAPAALGADPAVPTTTGVRGAPLQEPFTPATGGARLTSKKVVARFLDDPKVARWVARYPPHPMTEAAFDTATRRWTVKVWSGRAGEIALGKVEDGDGRVSEAWTGPQVAWDMARGRVGSFGGKTLNAWWMWIPLSVLFFVGLADWRRLRSWHTADLLALVSFGLSLWFFNRGEVFRSAPLGAVPLAYLLVRMCWTGFRGRAFTPVIFWPVWLLAAIAVFMGGLRIGLNIETPRGVIDVGYAGVIGGDRILDGQAPYGHMPIRDTGRPCGKADANGSVRDWIQANGRCESSLPRGDTYGPVSYLAYVPAVLAFPPSGKWDSLTAAHATAIVFDLLVVLGLLLVGRRFGGAPLAVALAFGWMALPFTAYALNSNTNDAIMPAILVWGFWLSTSPVARGAAVALSSWTKFATLLLAPLWLTYPNGLSRRAVVRFMAGFVVASLVAFSVLLLEPSPVVVLRAFVEHTFRYQLDRGSPFSPWDWGQYRARGIPDLGAVQLILQVGVLALAGVVAMIPQRKGPLELAALSAAVLVGFELTLTHWSYLYIPWFFPFVLLALLLPLRRADPAATVS
ncbi:MAG: hypothetical protein EXQ81_01840 [Thermoleophilia bacterium]|nr:hypothetical protein [Thermoleophilia bacterium]